MQWLNPWAWTGLVLLAVPIVVHLFSRKPPRVFDFPSLRFIQPSALRPTRRSSLHDIPLLLVRLAILGAAVMALAQPFRHAPDRSDGTSGTPVTGARGAPGAAASMAIVVERPMSATADQSDQRVRITGDTLHLTADDASGTTLRSNITRAVAWLRARPAPRTLIVRSTFARSVLDSGDVAMLPSDVQVVLDPLPVAADSSKQALASRDRSVLSTIARDTIEWITTLDPSTADAVVRTVHALGGAVVLVTARPASATSESGMQVSASLPRLLAAADDPTLRVLALTPPARWQFHPADTTAGQEKNRRLPLLFDAAGAVALSGTFSDARPALISHPPEQPTLAAAALLALSDNTAIHMRRMPPAIDTEYRTAASLRQWQRLPSASPIGVGAMTDIHTVPTFARWGWLLVFALVGLEWILRRRAT